MKREADEYITKDHGSTSRSSEEQKKMATPAQLAARKIKAPKSRVGRSTTPTLGSSSFGGQQQQSQPNFNFGNSNATQSFPPPSQQQSFNFSVPGTSSSFTFGQTNNDSQQVSNPFAAMNGSMGGQDNSMMQDSASQQPSTNGLFSGFGSVSQAAPAPSTNGFSFGQSSGAGFGGSSAFGQQKPQEESKPAFSAGLFGSQSQSNGSSSTFGQTSSSSFPATTSAAPSTTPFGGMSSAAPSPAPTFRFGETNVTESKSATPEPVDSTTPQAKPLFNFGPSATFSHGTLETEPPASAPAKPLFSFGQPSSAPVTSEQSATPSKPLFGMTSASSNPPEPATAPAKPLFNFGQPASKPADQAPATNPFGTPSRSAEPAVPSTSLFGRASPAAESQTSSVSGAATTEEPTEPEKPHNPFAGMFGAKPNSAQSDTTKSGFQFGSPAKQPVPASSDRSDKSDKPQSAFGFPAAAPTSDNTPTTRPATASSSAPNNLFNLNKPTPSAESEKASTQSQTTSSIFSRTNDMNFNAGSTPFKTTEQASVEDAGSAKKKLFQSPTAAESMSQFASGHSEKVPGPMEPVQPKFTQPQRPQPAKETITRAVSTEGPPQIPRYLSADKYRSYDENWRLKALNRKFKRVVASIDADREDFLSTVQNYLDHRESIGEGLAMWIKKQTAGSKRKPDDVDDMQTEGESSKRSKPDSAPTTKPAPSASSLFGSVPSPKPASNTSQARPSGQATSTMFKSLIPGATAAPSATQTAAPLFSFTPTPAKSTTPPSSPPKNSSAPQMPQFEMPKFATGTADFASAFAKNAASSVEKAEKEAKAKRKAEEFDSDEDDEEEWERKYEEEQRQKKAKLNSVAKPAFLPSFIPSASSTRSNSPFAFAAASAPRSESAQPLSDSEKAVISIESDGEGRTGSTSGESGHAGNESGNSGDDEDEEEDDIPEEQIADQPEEEEEGEPIPDLPRGESLFDRISKAPTSTTKEDPPIFGSAAKPYYKPAIMFDGMGKESPEQPTFSPFTPKGDFKPATSFNFTSTNTSGPSFGSSLIKDGPIPGEGLFGSRPSTPQPGNAKESASIFGSTPKSSTSLNNTWTKGSPIKFADSTSDQDAPAIEVSAATPPAASKSTSGSGFFGAASSSGGSVGFSFGGAPAQPAPGYLAAASHLSTGGTSGFSSRGSSPGLLSEAESVATDATTTQDEEHSNQPQISLMTSNAGEENEDVLFEAKAQLSRNYRKAELPENTRLVEGWNKVGTGNVKLLKDKESGKCRIVFRAEPNANILLNTRLVPTGNYNSQLSGRSNGSLSFPVAVENGIQFWVMKVKTKEQTDSLAKLINENKTK